MQMQALALKRNLSAQAKRCVLKKKSANPFEAYEVQASDVAAHAEKLKAGEVRTRLIASVVTPRDIFLMRNGQPGTVPGTAALLEVTEGDKTLAKGDRVQALLPQGGLWQSESVLPSAALAKVGAEVTPGNFGEYLATAQALALLRPYKRYDEVAVTEAQSALGAAVARVGSKQGLKVLTVVSPSYATEDSLKRLHACGAEANVVSEFEKQVQYVGSHAFRRLLADWHGLKLVVSADGGLLANELVRHLGEGGKMVVMGGAPITLPASAFALKNITVTGPVQPSAEDYAEAAKLVATITPEQKVKAVEFSLAEVFKAVDAFGLGPQCVLRATA